MNAAQHPHAQPQRPPRPALNPYDLSTWNRPTPPPHVQEPPTRISPSDEAGLEDEASRQGGADREGGARPSAEEPADPPELPRDLDTFELARRTLNRSRAAARDQGLYPISRKTQQRDVRDRSTSAPGFSGARPDPRDPQNIQAVLRRVLGDLGWNEGVSAGRVLEEWDEIVGAQVAQHVRPVSLDAGVLVVSASSSAWASQMRMLSAQMITTIEEHVGAHVISELRVTGPAAAQRSWKKGRRTVQWRGVRDTYG